MSLILGNLLAPLPESRCLMFAPYLLLFFIPRQLASCFTRRYSTDTRNSPLLTLVLDLTDNTFSLTVSPLQDYRHLPYLEDNTGSLSVFDNFKQFLIAVFLPFFSPPLCGVCVCVCARLQARGQLWAASSWPESVPIGLSRMPSKPWGYCLHLSYAGITSKCDHTWFFYVVSANRWQVLMLAQQAL